jgi:Protein of unknown function (DUF1580)
MGASLAAPIGFAKSLAAGRSVVAKTTNSPSQANVAKIANLLSLQSPLDLQTTSVFRTRPIRPCGFTHMIQPIDLRRETAITLAEVAQHLPKRKGRKVHYSTIFRWASKGVRGRTLETLLVGGVRFTTMEALGRFLDRPISNSANVSTLEGLAAVNQALDQAGL